MTTEPDNLIPVRTLSGRRSKPSMELLVDNQRVLSAYREPIKKKSKIDIKYYSGDSTLTTYSEKNSVLESEKVITKQATIPIKKVATIKTYDPVKKKSNKMKKMTNEIDEEVAKSSVIVNGINTKERSDKIIINAKEDIMKKTPFVSIEISNLIVPEDNDKSKIEKPVKIVDENPDDDLPLSTMFPDFKPNPEHQPQPQQPVEKLTHRENIVLPPKKKIRFVNINELNGSFNKTTHISVVTPSVEVKPKLADNAFPIIPVKKTAILDMPKIPKKSASSPSKSISVEVVNGSAEAPNDSSISNDYTPLVTVIPDDKQLSIIEPQQTPVDVSMISPSSTKRCIRESCTNIAIDDFRWDNEFCSPDCAVIHSRSVFDQWLNLRNSMPIVLQ